MVAQVILDKRITLDKHIALDAFAPCRENVAEADPESSIRPDSKRDMKTD